MPNEQVDTTNPCYTDIKQDLTNRDKWASIDSQILTRRLAERKKNRTHPYKKAPNRVIPIVDDNTREKTTQEITMLNNAPLLANIIPLTEGMTPEMRRMAEVGFDTYLRHIIKILPKMEEAVDCKNARGFAVVKIIRRESDRWGVLSDIEIKDPRNIVVPTDTKEILDAERITEAFYYTERKFRKMAEEMPWNKQAVDAIIEKKKADRESKSGDISDSFAETSHLFGVDASQGVSDIVIWQHWTYANDFIVEKDDTGQLAKGDKCCIIFSPDMPDEIVYCFPWRKDDIEIQVDLTEEERLEELQTALDEGRDPVLIRIETEKGQEKPWPFIQPRYENRSSYYYDSRGIGHLCMDEQITASAITNAKLVLIEYYQSPLFEGPADRNSGNISFEPGSVLPEGVKPSAMPNVPPQMDFEVELERRSAARRVGAMSQYEFSGEMSSRKGIQKTAREVEEESIRGTMLSSADTDRFNSPWSEVFQQIWENLKQMQKPLPMIEGGDFTGMAGPDIYQYDVLVVPAGNAKTYNPDAQFMRATRAWDVLTKGFASLGVVVDPEEAARDVLAHWDPLRAKKWIKSADESTTGPQQPVYEILRKLAQTAEQNGQRVEALTELSKRLAKLAEENSGRLDRIQTTQARHTGQRTAAPGVA
jgi:hypothetical protein